MHLKGPRAAAHLAIDRKRGLIFNTEYDTQVQVLTLGGEQVRHFSLGKESWIPTALALNSTGEVAVVDTLCMCSVVNANICASLAALAASWSFAVQSQQNGVASRDAHFFLDQPLREVRNRSCVGSFLSPAQIDALQSHHEIVTVL